MSQFFAVCRRLAVIAAFMSLPCVVVYAEESEFLKYQEPKTQVSLLSSVDTILYTITMFLFILALAYLTSRFVGGKLASHSTGSNGDAVLSSLSLGSNKGIHLVKFANRLLILSVAEQQVTLLADLTDASDAADLMASYQVEARLHAAPQFSAVFESQLTAMRQLSQKFPRVLGNYGGSSPDNERGQEKR